MAARRGLDSVPPNTAIIAAIACSIIAVAALTELAPPEVRGRRAVTALTGGHGVAAAIMLAGVAPSVPWSMPLAGLALSVVAHWRRTIRRTRSARGCGAEPRPASPDRRRFTTLQAMATASTKVLTEALKLSVQERVRYRVATYMLQASLP